MKRVFFLLLLTFTQILFSSCTPYKKPIKKFNHYNCKQDHPLYNLIPKHRCQIRWYDIPHWIAWAIFGNDDDGIFGEGSKAHYKPQFPASYHKAIQWFFRNPFHNFTFYIIGSAYRTNSEIDILRMTSKKIESGKYRYPAQFNFASKRNSGLYIALHGGKPYISLRIFHCPHRKSDFYIGWRSRGNFGIKCNLWRPAKSRLSQNI
ncbi:MAG: hypothetical protein VX777_02940 [Chlamydiota bacterium]|nr:hypothetical protein [Chlamydiota bacterium]